MLLFLFLLIEMTQPITGMLALPGFQDNGILRGPCVMAAQPDPAHIVQVIEFFPEAIPDHPTPNGGVFYRQTVTLTVQQGQRLWLTGTVLDLTLAKEEIINVKGMPSGKVWTLQYLPPTWKQRVSLAQPHNLTSILVEGENTLAIEFVDVLRPADSSRPYWLVIEEACSYLPEASPTATESPPPTPSPPPTATPTPVPTATATPTPTETATPTPQVKATEPGEEIIIVSTPTATPVDQQRRSPPPLGQIIVLTILAIIVIRKAWNARPRRR